MNATTCRRNALLAVALMLLHALPFTCAVIITHVTWMQDGVERTMSIDEYDQFCEGIAAARGADRPFPDTKGSVSCRWSHANPTAATLCRRVCTETTLATQTSEDTVYQVSEEASK